MTPTTTKTDLSWMKRCTAVQVQFGQLSFTKKLPRATVTTMVTTAEDATTVLTQSLDDGGIEPRARRSDPSRISASKRLLDCPQAEAIRSEFNRLRTFIVSRTLPSPFGKGIYFVPNTRIEEVYNEILMAETTTIPHLGEALIAVLNDVLVREAEALGPNFNQADYDTPDEIRERLGVKCALITFGVPEELPAHIHQREVEKQGQRLMESVDMMQALLRSEFQELLTHAAEKLSGTKGDGKPKVFRNSLVTNIQEFLQLFRDRNITNDAELAALCDRAKQLLEGVNPQDLRDKEPLRESVARAFSEMRTQLDSMLVPRGSRSIMLDDDEPATAEQAAA